MLMSTTQTTTHQAEIIGEYRPFGEGAVHGVTFDGKLVWFARDNELVAFDPDSEKVTRRPQDARVRQGHRQRDGLGRRDTSGSASIALAKIHQIDAKTGEIIKTRAQHISGIESNGKGAFWCGGEGGKLRLVQKTAKS